MSDITRRKRLAAEITDAIDTHTREHAADLMRRYRPTLAEEFGEDITARIADAPELLDLVVELDGELEADDISREAAKYLRDHPEASVGEAFAAVREA
jgi:hypothetical protein